MYLYFVYQKVMQLFEYTDMVYFIIFLNKIITCVLYFASKPRGVSLY